MGRVINLCVEHNHTTGRIRGLLCNNCNRGVGLLKDNLNILKRAIIYLQEDMSFQQDNIKTVKILINRKEKA